MKFFPIWTIVVTAAAFSLFTVVQPKPQLSADNPDRLQLYRRLVDALVKRNSDTSSTAAAFLSVSKRRESRLLEKRRRPSTWDEVEAIQANYFARRLIFLGDKNKDGLINIRTELKPFLASNDEFMEEAFVMDGGLSEMAFIALYEVGDYFDGNKDGRLNRKEIIKTIHALQNPPSMPRGIVERKLFKLADLNKDGKLELDSEFKDVLGELYSYYFNPSSFSEMDTNKNGYIDLDELIAGMEAVKAYEYEDIVKGAIEEKKRE